MFILMEIMGDELEKQWKEKGSLEALSTIGLINANLSADFMEWERNARFGKQ